MTATRNIDIFDMWVQKTISLLTHKSEILPNIRDFPCFNLFSLFVNLLRQEETCGQTDLSVDTPSINFLPMFLLPKTNNSPSSPLSPSAFFIADFKELVKVCDFHKSLCLPILCQSTCYNSFLLKFVSVMILILSVTSFVK